jgi:hypothetical protein
VIRLKVMRQLPLVIVLAAGTGALASPKPAPVVAPSTTWADWVGDWQGKLTWTGCAAPGEASATLPVEAVDGAVAIDLGPAGGALRELTLAEDGAGWLGQQGDVAVRLALGKRGTLELAVDLDSGCRVRGALRRATVGIAACDQLAAWARIESRCTKLSRPALENAARLARQRATWIEARGDARAKLATQCEARSAKVALELVDAGCAPNPDPAIGLRGAECQAMRRSAARLGKCASVPADMREAIGREVVVLLAAAQGADRASLPVVEGECRRARERIAALAQHVGCPP